MDAKSVNELQIQYSSMDLDDDDDGKKSDELNENICYCFF